jgi:hypothetical protein
LLSPSLPLTLTASGLLDSSGRPLDGNRDGQPGGTFVAVLGKAGAMMTRVVTID